jgi:hypothetical protein
MTKTEVKNFRSDFQKAIAQLEKQYGVQIGLGTIRFNNNELRAKMTATKGGSIERLDKNDFNVGDIVSINHKKINPKDLFRVIKINSKNILVEEITDNRFRVRQINVSPSLLIKK